MTHETDVLAGEEGTSPQLTPTAKELYLHALRAGRVPHPSADGTPTPEEADTLSTLLRLGLLAADETGPSWLVPVDPRLAAAAVRRRARLRSAQIEEYGAKVVSDLIGLSQEYDQASNTGPDDAPFQELIGLQMITSAIEDAMAQCKEEALTVQPGNGRSAQALERALKKATAVMERGVRLRTLYQHPTRFNEPTRDYVAKVSSIGAEVRTLDELPRRLMIFDRKTAFVSAAQDSRRAVLVRHPALVAFLVESFERDWRRASPYDVRYRNGSAIEGLNEVQQTILRMLVNGESDDAIARRLSLNVRTCRAHIAKALTAFNARTRVQMAYQLGRSGTAALE